MVLPLPPKSLPPKNEKPPTAKKLLPYCITAEKIPPFFCFTASAKVVTAKNEKTANRLKITALWQYRPACVRLKKRYRRPPEFFLGNLGLRDPTFPAKNKKPLTAKKIPPYCITAEKIPPYFGFTATAKVVTAKNEKTANRLKITAVWQYRPACVRLKKRHRRQP